MKRKALFIINSLGNGGAERVCVNMAEELVKENYEVDFLVLNLNSDDKNKYELIDDFNIYSLECESHYKLLRFIKLLSKVQVANKYIKMREKTGQYSLITSHLPRANIITRLSIVSKRSIYVFHTKIRTYDKIDHRLFTKIFNLFFYRRKVVCVSDGLRNEGINEYGMNKKYLRTIYNPIDLDLIRTKSLEEIDNEFQEKKYILQVGRFNEAKRQDRALQVFYKGELYKDYILIYCGVGELENDIKSKVKKFGLEKSVKFLGWQTNVYKWIKNASILLCTSDYEAFPMNLIEAIACNTKVVASNCNFGPNEIMIGEYKKFLVETDNIDDYIKKIHYAETNYPIEKNEILQKCKARNIIKNYISFYEEVIE